MGSEVVTSILSLGSGFLGYLLPFLFVLTIVVFFHELGHFLVARWVGVRVLVFSVGFGPELLGFTDRHGTRWKLSAIPLGGYVKFFGDQNAASVPDEDTVAAMTAEERSQSFYYKSLPRRAAVVAAGPIANFILAILIFASVFMLHGKPATSARVDVVQAGSAAEAAGFKAGDLIESEIDVLVHPQSIVHGLVEFRDGSMIAQLGAPDMRIPIAHCLAWPARIQAPATRLDLAAIANLSFGQPDLERFPALAVARRALVTGGAAPTILNAANEVAVREFVEHRLGFTGISALVEATLEAAERDGVTKEPASLEEAVAIDRMGRSLASSLLPEIAAKTA